jgi:hypothetical protein
LREQVAGQNHNGGSYIMAAKRPKKCPCGCGQATVETTRMRLVKCPSCTPDYTARMSRKVLARGLPLCGVCGSRMLAPCAYDRAAAGDEEAEKLVTHLGLVQYARERGIGKRRTSLGRRPQPRCQNVGCGRFMPFGGGPCASCNFDPINGYSDPIPF